MSKLRQKATVARPERAGRSRLLRACNESGLTQEQLGRLVGTDDRGVRRLLRRDRVRADRLDLLVAIERLSPRHGETNGLGARYVATEDDTARKEPLDARGGSWAVATATATQGPTSGDSRERPALLRSRAAVARQAHNLKVDGSIPSCATTGAPASHVSGESPAEETTAAAMALAPRGRRAA